MKNITASGRVDRMQRERRLVAGKVVVPFEVPSAAPPARYDGSLASVGQERPNRTRWIGPPRDHRRERTGEHAVIRQLQESLKGRTTFSALEVPNDSGANLACDSRHPGHPKVPSTGVYTHVIPSREIAT
ncbi:MAG: hypothetical protein ACR2JC_00320 [Chloroflexota bacterium]